MRRLSWIVFLSLIHPAWLFSSPPQRVLVRTPNANSCDNRDDSIANSRRDDRLGHPPSSSPPGRLRRLPSLPPALEDLVADALDSDRKIVVVTGGVLSGIGKGVTASSMGVLLRAMGYRVTALKIDPYLNVDAGTMSPFEHGEVFVLDDGGGERR